MSKFAMFFKRKSIGFYLMAAAFVFGVVGFVLFLLTMRAQENMMVWIVILSVAALAASVVVCALRDYLRLTGILCVALYLLCGLLFLVTQAENIGYAITHTNIGDGIMPSFVAGLVFYLLAALTSAVASYFPQERLMSDN